MGIKIEYMPFCDVQHQPQAWQDRILGAVCFGESSLSLNEGILNGNLLAIHLNTPVLEGENIACEVWLNDSPMSDASSNLIVSANKGDIHYRLNDELLFGVISLDELAFSQGQSQQTQRDISPLQLATEAAYRQIFELIDELGYVHLYRFWNYMSDINGTSHDLERYRQFNVGRKHVFMQTGREAGSELPAACALGIAKGPLSIAFLVGKVATVAIENPRQIKAYDYPEQYGPSTPSFSRAALLHDGSQATLFISGTASIVGHETKHALDATAQTRETLLNLESVIAEANRVLGQPKFNLHDAYFRVYMRYAQDVDAVRAELQAYTKGKINAMFVQADICRHDLLIEIEATLQSVVESA